MTNDKRRALLTRLTPETASAVQASAHALNVSISDYLAVAAAEKVARDGTAISLAHDASEQEIARLSRIADQMTGEISGKRRGSDA